MHTYIHTHEHTLQYHYACGSVDIWCDSTENCLSFIEYFIDLFVANINFDTLLMGSVLMNFSSVMQLVLQSEELLVEDLHLGDTIFHSQLEGNNMKGTPI